MSKNNDKHDRLRFGAIDDRAVHLCVDMQRLFAEDTDWHTPWMERVLPNVERVAAAHPAETIFTRFIPAERPGEGCGSWSRYYETWESMTTAHIGRDTIELVLSLARLARPAEIVDKHTYSPWIDTDLHARLQARSIDTLIVTGGETDVCVLASMLGAVDHGYRIVVVTDALCSSSDETHDAMMTLYHGRYGQQVETIETDLVLAAWR